jgi:hypothetical protein
MGSRKSKFVFAQRRYIEAYGPIGFDRPTYECPFDGQQFTSIGMLNYHIATMHLTSSNSVTASAEPTNATARPAAAVHASSSTTQTSGRCKRSNPQPDYGSSVSHERHPYSSGCSHQHIPSSSGSGDHQHSPRYNYGCLSG